MKDLSPGEPVVTDESAATLRAFYDSSRMLMGVVELLDDGDILHVDDNPATARFFGVPLGSTAGRRSVADLNVDRNVVDIWRGRYLESERVGGAVQFEYPFDDRGAQRWLGVTVFPIGPAPGGRTRFSYMAEEITDRKHAEDVLRESEERFRATFDNAAVGIAHVGLDGAWLRMNDRVCAITGYPREELQNLTFAQITHPDDVDADWGYARRLMAGEIKTYTMEKRYVRKDGFIVPIQLTVSLVRAPDSTPRYMISVIEDITARKAAEEALREADRRKDEFLATLAHELRNPLAPISNAVHVLKAPNAGPARLAWAREIIERQLQHMVRLLDDLLDLNRISRGKVQLRRERLDISSVLESAIETSRPLIESNRHVLTVNLPPDALPVEGDRVRLAQLFSNLLNNAARYTPAGGRIEVAAAREDTMVVVRVRDNGVGIAPTMLGRIFDMFVQGERSGEAGLGIGLSLVKALVEMHGGRVEAKSDGRGSGTELVVQLPLAKPAVDRPALPSSPGAGVASLSRRVLIVDDLRDNADSLAMLLQQLGHQVRVAYNGEDAIAAWREMTPEVAVLDLGMPGVDGLETCRRLRAEPGGRDACMVALTGWGQHHDRRRTAEAGFDRHLVKPAEIGALLEILAALPERATLGSVA